MPGLTLRSPAKINLGLEVGPRRPDGFHDLVTIIVPLEFGDTITIRTAPKGITVRTSPPRVPSGRRNIAWRAAEAFYGAAGIDPGCRIEIGKRIPVGGGLGGGSSNAATVLTGLNRLYGSPLGPRTLHRLAAGLGSDVPAFLRRGASVARGRGERLRPIRLPRLDVLLHFPRASVGTAWAYAELDRQRRTGADLTWPAFWPKMLGLHLRRNEPGRAAARIRNSFEPVVFERFPALARAKSLLLSHGAYAASLSGSGSTVYGLVRSEGWKDPMAALRRIGLPCIKTSSITAES